MTRRIVLWPDRLDPLTPGAGRYFLLILSASVVVALTLAVIANLVADGAPPPAASPDPEPSPAATPTGSGHPANWPALLRHDDRAVEPAQEAESERHPLRRAQTLPAKPLQDGDQPDPEPDPDPLPIEPPGPYDSWHGPCTVSWYGEAHRGLTTASGVPFDPDEFTVASWEHDFGTVLEVRHGDATVLVEVTDRGPARRLNRCLDLSAAAFGALAPLGAGLIRAEWREVGR